MWKRDLTIQPFLRDVEHPEPSSREYHFRLGIFGSDTLTVKTNSTENRQDNTIELYYSSGSVSKKPFLTLRSTEQGWYSEELEQMPSFERFSYPQ